MRCPLSFWEQQIKDIGLHFYRRGSLNPPDLRLFRLSDIRLSALGNLILSDYLSRDQGLDPAYSLLSSFDNSLLTKKIPKSSSRQAKPAETATSEQLAPPGLGKSIW